MQTLQPRGQIGFRLIRDTDRDFLFDLYAETREWEFRLTRWSPEDKRDFLERQFTLREQGYRMQFPGAVFRILQLDGEDIGRLTVDRQDDCLRIIDLTIAAPWRGRGIGTDLLRSLINEAHGGKVPVRLSVERNNPAMALYTRHGFVVTGEMGTHLALEWRPPSGPRWI